VVGGSKVELAMVKRKVQITETDGKKGRMIRMDKDEWWMNGWMMNGWMMNG
jgi:hypothetical protein